MFPLISPPNVPIPVVDPADTKGYWTVSISSESLIEIIWCMADVFPQDTRTSDFTELSSVLLIVAYVIVLPVALEIPDSNLAVLSVAEGWPNTENLYVPIPEVVVTNPTMLDLTLSISLVKFSTCNLTRLFSNLAVIMPTADWLAPFSVSIYVWAVVVSVPSKSTITSL